MLIPILLSVTQLATGSDTLLVRLPAIPSEEIELQLEEELRLGTLDGDEEESFGFVTGVVVDPSGVLFIADARPSEVRRFDRNGEFLGVVGREGEGPGEYRQIHGITLLPDGQLALWDHNRISVFDSAGAFVRSFQIGVQALIPGRDSFASDRAGRLLLRTAAEAPRLVGGASEAVFAWVRYTADGGFIDSVIPPRRNVGGSLGAFKIETSTVPSPLGYFITGRNSEYALHRPLRGGRVVRIERPVDPVPVHPDERRQLSAYSAEVDRRMGYTSEDVPESKPPWRSLFVDTDGRIWVSRYTKAVQQPGYESRAFQNGGLPNVDWLEPVLFDVIDPRGLLVGAVKLPAGSEIAFSRGDHVWVIERGSFDEQYVVRYRMATPDGDP